MRLSFVFFSIFALSVHCQEENTNGDELDEGEPPVDEEDVDPTMPSLTSEQLRSLHSNIDADKDGKISLAETLEYSMVMSRSMAKKEQEEGTMVEDFDTDKDGKLSKEEIINGTFGEVPSGELREEIIDEEKKFHAVDSNKDGFLEKDELHGFFHPEIHEGVLEVLAAATMKEKDTNHDGQLTPHEFYHATPMPQETDDDPSSWSPHAEELAQFKVLDVDASGTIDLKELKPWESGSFHLEETMGILFTLADKDSDSMLTTDELDAAGKILEQQANGAKLHFIDWAAHNEL